MVESLCEIVRQEINLSGQLLLVCDWVDEGIYFFQVFSDLSENNQIIVGMFLGGLMARYLRRFYIHCVRKRLLEII